VRKKWYRIYQGLNFVRKKKERELSSRKDFKRANSA
jgi:hypothetical protein